MRRYFLYPRDYLRSSPSPVPLVDMTEDDFDIVALDMQQVLESPSSPVL